MTRRVSICLLPILGFASAASPPQTTAAAPSALDRVPSLRVLVMPFEATNQDPRAYWLREAASILMTENLARLGIDTTTRRERVRAFLRLQLPAAAPLSRAMIVKVGQLVGATALVVGSIEVNDQQLVARARTILLDAGRASAEMVERGSPEQLFEIFQRLTGRLAESSRWRAGEGAAPEQNVSLEAFENVVKGLVAENPAMQVQFLERALALAPGDERARLALWEAYAELDEHERALNAVRPVAGTSPMVRRAQFAAAVSLIELKQYAEAFGILTKLTDGAGAAAAASAFNNLGVLQLRRGVAQYGKPVYFFNRAVESDPSDPDYAFNLGYAYWLDHDNQAAIYWLREAVRREPGDREAHLVLGKALEASGALVEAGRERELAARLAPELADPAEVRRETLDARATEGLERLKLDLEAPLADRVDRVIISAAQREQRELAAFHLDQGRRLFEQERDREALAELRRAVYIEPYEGEAHLLIGRLHLRNGRIRDAIEALVIAVWSAETVPGHLLLAEAYLQAGEPDKARQAAERARVLDPQSAEARRLLDRIPASPR